MITVAISAALEKRIRSESKMGGVALELVNLLDTAYARREVRRIRARVFPGPKQVVEIAISVLGESLILPPAIERRDWKAATPQLSQIRNRVTMLGLQASDVERAANAALETMMLPVTLERFMRSLDKLLATQTTGGRVTLGLPDDDG